MCARETDSSSQFQSGAELETPIFFYRLLKPAADLFSDFLIFPDFAYLHLGRRVYLATVHLPGRESGLP